MQLSRQRTKNLCHTFGEEYVSCLVKRMNVIYIIKGIYIKGLYIKGIYI